MKGIDTPAPSPEPAKSALRLRVRPVAESHIRRGHPWIFSESITEQNREGTAGEIAVIYDRGNKFLALGLCDPWSPLRVRILHTGKPVKIDAEWWEARFRAAIERRAGLFGPETNGYRWINGESDGLPGLVLDRYADTLVLKLYTAAWLPRLDEIAALLGRELQPAALMLRLSRNLQDRARNDFNRAEGFLPLRGTWSGRPPEPVVLFKEHGITFEADVAQGQKTGFFLDQRENRRRVSGLAAGKHVLNAFSFSGGFSLHAAQGGAASVTDLDISGHALDAAKRNFAHNQHIPAVAACRHTCTQADCFDWMAHAPRQKDCNFIILDPPSLAKRETEREGALQAYSRLAADALTRLGRGGILLAASCSAHVSSDEFFATILRTIAVRTPVELFRATHPADHPATFPEAQYLKTICFRT